MKLFVILLILFTGMSVTYSQTITQVEWFVGTDPGVGMGNPITISEPNDSLQLNFVVPTGSLTPGLYRVFVRCQFDSSVWGVPSLRFISIAPGDGTVKLVTACEYWFDNSTPTFLDVGDSNLVSFEQLLSTTSLNPGLHRFYIRYRDDLGRWGVPHGKLLSVSNSIPIITQVVTQIKYWVDSNPFTVIDVTDSALVEIDELISTLSLGIGLHNLYMQCQDENGRWGAADKRSLIVTSLCNPFQERDITQIEYWVDGNSSTLVDIVDSAQVSISEFIGTLSLGIGLHEVFLRCRDENGRWGAADKRSLIVTSPSGVSQSRYITHLEYWVDGGLPTLVDIIDSAQVNINEFIGTLSLGIGLHEVFLRCQDDFGRWSGLEQRVLIVTSPVSVVEQKVLTAAEYFVNVDPGPGNGTPIPLPSDSIWDEGEETVHSVITGLPLGLYLVGMRVQDETGRWSKAVFDSMLVGPILSISVSGNNIILDWLSGSGAEAFHIYRSGTLGGQFVEIDSTTAQTYMDVGIITTDPKAFYRVTFSPRTLSGYRLPQNPQK